VHADVLTALGYTLKDREQPWYVNRCSTLFTPKLQEIALAKYMMLAKIATKGETNLTNKNLCDKVHGFLHVRGKEHHGVVITEARGPSFVRKQHARLTVAVRALGPRLVLHIYCGPTGVGKTRGAKTRFPNSIDWIMWSRTRSSRGGAANSCRGRAPSSSSTTSSTTATLTSSSRSCARPRPGQCSAPGRAWCKPSTARTCTSEEWYTTPRGDVQAEWLLRLRDFAILYEVKPGGVGPDGVCTTQGVPYRDLEEARMAAREARRAAAAAAMDAALDSDSSDS